MQAYKSQNIIDNPLLFQLLGVYLGANLITPEYEHQEEYYFFIRKPQEKRLTYC